jgi:dephospho-CoA kinase
LRAQIEAVRQDLPLDTIAVYEIPLLFETKLQEWFERIVVVCASETVQVARLSKRNGLDQVEARRRLAAQWPLMQKVAHADYVLQNNGSRADLVRAVDGLWRWLKSLETVDA